MIYLITQTLNGLFSAALLFLIASGLTLAFGVMRIVNIAHGSFYMLGVYVAYSVFTRTQSLLLSAIVAMVVGNGVKQGTDPRLVPPVSVAAARRLPNYGAPHGWKAAMTKEVRRVEGFNAWELVRFSEYWKIQRAYPN